MINHLESTFDMPTQGWAHKALFGGIVAGVGIVVSIGMLVYGALQPVQAGRLGDSGYGSKSAVATRSDR